MNLRWLQPRAWRCLLAIGLLFYGLSATAAVWRLAPDGFEIDDLALAPNAGFVAVGRTNAIDGTGDDAFLLGLDKDGQALWQKALGGGEDDQAVRLRQTGTGGHVVAVQTESIGDASADVRKREKILILKLDHEGAIGWQKLYGTALSSGQEEADRVNDILVTKDQGYLVVGFTVTPSDGQAGLVMKLSSSGTIEWQERLALSVDRSMDVIRAIQTDDDGYLIAANAENDPVLVKLSSSGGIEWSRYFDDPDEYTYYWADWISAVIETSDGGYLLALGADRGEYTEDIVLLKLSANGRIEWQGFYGTRGGYNTGGKENLADLHEVDGGYLLGLTYRAPWASSVIMKISYAGDILFQHRPSGGKYVDRFLQTGDGGYALAGTYLQKLDARFGYGRTEEGGCSLYGSDVARSDSAFFIDDSISVSAEPATLGAQDASFPVSVMALDVDRSCYEPDSVQLIVSKTGSGLISTQPKGIHCGDLCVGDFALGSTVTLEAVPGFGQRFVGWGGACSGQEAACQIEITGPLSVEARFEPTLAFDSTWRLQYYDGYRGRSESIKSMAASFDGTFRAVGRTTEDGSDNDDIFVMSLAPDGGVLWQRWIGRGADEWGERIRETPAGTHVIAGITRSYGYADNDNDADRNEIVLTEIDRDGEILWQRTYGSLFTDGEAADEVADLIVTDDAGYLIGGMSVDATGQHLAFAMKLSRTGIVEWQRRFAISTGDDSSLSRVIQTMDGGYALAGGAGLDAFLLKVDASGHLTWSRYFEDPYEGTYQNSEWPTTLIQSQDGGYLLGLKAEIDEWDYMDDAALLKLSEDGSIEWQYLYGVSGHQNWARDWPVDIIERADRFIVGFVYARDYRGAAILEIAKGSGEILSQVGYSNIGNPDELLAVPGGGYAFASDDLAKLNEDFGFSCDPGTDQDCNCNPYDIEMDRRPAEYFVVDEVTFTSEIARLQGSARDLSDGGLQLETWLSCYPPVPQLVVTKTGQGDVVSDPPGINCGEVCSATFPAGTSVILDALPHLGHRLGSWEGACTSSSSTCEVFFDQPLAVQANFVEDNYQVQVQTVGAGSVTSDPSGIDCGAVCAASFPNGTQVTLSPAADAGLALAGWGGDCSDGEETCRLTVVEDLSVEARFMRLATCELGPLLLSSDTGIGGQALYLSEATIATSGAFRILDGAHVELHAAGRITLNAGFESEPGSRFAAGIRAVSCR